MRACKMNYKWLFSYETPKFDTLDGNIHAGEYAKIDKREDLLVNDPTGELDFLRVEPFDTKDLTEVKIIGSRAFDVFEDPDTKKQVKFSSSVQEYRNLAQPEAGPRIKIKE
jgi:hypothetical protein